MPDDFSSLVDSSMPRSNPLGSFVQGMNNGAEWAHSMASLDLQKQTIQNQLANHQLMQSEFEFKKGQQKISDYKELLGLDAGPYQNTKIDMFKEMYPDTKDTWLAAAKDANMKESISGALSQLDSQMNKQLGMSPDPESQAMYKQLIGKFGMGFAQDLSKNKLENAPKVLEAAFMKRAMMDAANQRQNVRISAQEMNKGIQGAEKATQNDSMVLRTMQEMQNLHVAMDKGEIKSTPQLLSKIQAIEARVANGNGKLTEGTMERQRSENVLGMLVNWEQKIASSPKDAPIAPWVTQIEGESNNMMKAYMDDVDRHHDILHNTYQDYPQAVGAIDRYFNTTRNSFHKSMPSGWLGFKKPTEAKPAEAAATTQNGKPAPTDQDKATARQMQGKLHQGLELFKDNPAKLKELKTKIRSLVHPDLADKVESGEKI